MTFGLTLRFKIPLALVLALLFGANADAQEAYCPVQLSPWELDRFLQVATRAEYDDAGRDYVVKWMDDVHIAVHGTPTTQDMETLNLVVSELNALVDGVQIDVVAKNGNIDIYFVDIEDYAEIARTVWDYERNNWHDIEGYFLYWADGNHVLYRGGILLNANGDPDVRRSIIREEVTQLLGLTNDVPGDPRSIFDPDFNLHAFSPTDGRLIQALYCDALQPGMREGDVRQLLAGGGAK